jgi:hypothetical protein
VKLGIPKNCSLIRARINPLYIYPQSRRKRTRPWITSHLNAITSTALKMKEEQVLSPPLLQPNHPHHRRVNTTSGRNNHQETPLPLLATTAGQKLRCYRVEGITPLFLLATSAGQQERKNTIPELQEAACSH